MIYYEHMNLPEILPKLSGAIGLVLITYAIFVRKEIKQDWFFVSGGLFLLVYSISLRDPVFIPLQIIFTGASLYEIYTIKNRKVLKIKN